MLWAIEKPILLMVHFPFNNTHHFFRWAPKSDSKNCSCNAYKDQTTENLIKMRVADLVYNILCD